MFGQFDDSIWVVHSVVGDRLYLYMFLKELICNVGFLTSYGDALKVDF